MRRTSQAPTEAESECTAMAVTKSWELSQTVRFGPQEIPVPRERRRELFWLLGASLVVTAGLALVLLAKTEDFAGQQARIDSGEVLDLNTVTSRQQLLPFLQVYADPPNASRSRKKSGPTSRAISLCRMWERWPAFA